MTRPSLAASARRALGLALASLLALGGVLTAAGTATAAPAPAFDCSDPRFFAQAENPVGTAQLYEGTYNSEGDSVWTPLGSPATGNSVYNALAFNPVDEYLYGTIYGGTVPGTLVRINRDGVIENIGNSSPALGSTYSTLWDSGEFDSAGNYYVGSGNAGAAANANIRKISGLAGTTSASATRPSLTTITLSPTPRYADFTFKDGFLWAMDYNQSATIYRIDPTITSGTNVTAFSVSGVLPTSAYGSAFTMTNGNLAFIATNNNMYQVSVADAASATPTFELVSVVGAPANQRSDASNCSTAQPASLSVEKSGPETVVVGESIEWQIVVTNDGPGTSSGFVLNDLLPAGISDVAVTSDDSGCVVNGAQTTITCNGGRLLVGETAEVTVTATAPTTVGALVNRVQVIGNEDADPDDFTSAETTVTLGTRVGEPVSITDDASSGDTTSVEGGSVGYADGVITYTPPSGFSGVDSFSYTTAGGDVVTVHVTVRPVANDDSDSTGIDTALTIPESELLANDEGAALDVTAVGSAVNGTVALDGDSVIFTPTSGYHGTGSFEYTLTADGGTDTATVTIDIDPVPADAVDDAVDATSEQPLTITRAQLLSNDSGTGIALTDYTQPVNGTVSTDPDGELVYTSDDDFSGEDSFTYEITGAGGSDWATVTVTVAPVATSAVDDSVLADSDSPVTIALADLLANDSGTAIDVSEWTQPASGAVAANGDGDLVYTPDDDFHGEDSFTYTLSGPGGTDTATVTVTVTPLPTAAVDDTAGTTAGSSTTIDIADLLADDSGTAIAFDSFTQPANGSVTVNSDGDLEYAPSAGFSGEDSFTYTITGAAGPDTATVTVDVSPAAFADELETDAQQPGSVDVIANDLGTGLTLTAVAAGAHGVVTIVDGDAQYTPDDGYSGSDSFTYTATDAAGSTATGTVAVTVLPVANDDDADVVAGGSVEIDALADDLGRSLSIVETTSGSNGAASIDDGSITYAPDAGYSGPDSFTYTIEDADGQRDTATVTVDVAPLAVDDSRSTGTGVAITIDVVANDLGSALAITGFEQGANGAVAEDDGELVYTPSAGWSGPDSFDYEVTDAHGQAAEATVDVLVTPLAPDDAATTTVGVAVTIDVLDNDSGAGLQIVSTTSASNGVVAFTPDAIDYTPAAGWSGIDEFDYTIEDDLGSQATATVTVYVRPVAVLDAQTLVVDGSATFDARSNDAGTDLRVTAASALGAGAAVVNPDGTITYTAEPGFSGTDTIEYELTDADGQSVTGTVQVTVTPTAIDDHVEVVQGETVAFSITDNDRGTALVVTASSEPGHGGLELGDDGSASYSASDEFAGIDGFDYEVEDAEGQVATATVVIIVTASELAATGVEPVLAVLAALLLIAAGAVAGGLRMAPKSARGRHARA